MHRDDLHKFFIKSFIKENYLVIRDWQFIKYFGEEKEFRISYQSSKRGRRESKILNK